MRGLGQVAKIDKSKSDRLSNPCFSLRVPALDTLLFFPDSSPRTGPEQMALDEALLEQVQAPVLRTYTWAGDWVSFGYSQSFSAVTENVPGRQLVRRWTGGGIVPHYPDWTFALIVPRNASLAQIRPIASYCQIHEAISSALERIAVATALSSDPVEGAQVACFQGHPAQYDVLTPGGTKLCGGAQRRTRQGFLHQGSLQHVSVPIGFGQELAEALSTHWKFHEPSRETLLLAEQLAAQKYAAPAWTYRTP